MMGRETPLYIMQHLILSFGGSFVTQDLLPDELEEAKAYAQVMKKVTHICMDRPLATGVQKDKSKEYVQP